MEAYYKALRSPDGRPFLSNSGLNAIVKGSIADKKVLKFGRAFHSAILEPFKQQEDLADNKERLLFFDIVARMQAEISDILLDRRYKFEHEIYRKIFGFWFKGKLDIVSKTNIIDLKTTSCNTDNAFQASIVKYYLQQVAVYFALVPTAQNFEFIGIEKKIGGGIFRYNVQRSSFEHFLGVDELLTNLNKVEYDTERGIFKLA